MRKVLLATAMALGVASGAQAADLAAPRTPIAAAVAMPAFSWTGFYLGVQIGGAWARQGGDNTTLALTNPLPLPGGSGIVGGVHVGFNYQINAVVVGLEADIEAASISGRRNNVAGPLVGLFDLTMRQNFMGSLRGRLGLAADRTLFYVTGGVAFTNARNTLAIAGGAPFHIATTSRAGWTVGVGVEHAFSPNWTARVEYRYANFGSFTQTDVTSNSQFNVRPKEDHAIRLGVSYLFSTGSSAVVARY